LHPQHGARGFSFEIEEASPSPPELERLDLDWSDLAGSGADEAAAPEAAAPEAAAPEAAAPERPAPTPSDASGPQLERIVVPSAGTPLMPHAAADRGSPRPLRAAFPPATAPSAALKAPADAHPGSPMVRRLRFPDAPAARKPSPRPSTRFADSIGRSRPLGDAASELLLTTADPPEDLPLPQHQDASPEAPLADERRSPLALRATALWSSAKDTAVDLGGRGVESGRLLAHQMSDALRERLERKMASPSVVPADAAADSTRRASSPPHSLPRDDAPVTPSAPPSAPRRLALPRKSGGPLLALVAAAGMFIASRQLLGTGVGLSKSAPSVPELGEVDGPAAARTPDASARTESPESGRAAQGPVPPMVTEVVPLPPGLAWPGKGLLEVVTSEDELVYVDGVFTGRGPLRRVPVTPGEHEVSIRKEGSERHGTAAVELGRTTRALFRRP